MMRLRSYCLLASCLALATFGKEEKAAEYVETSRHKGRSHKVTAKAAENTKIAAEAFVQAHSFAQVGEVGKGTAGGKFEAIDMGGERGGAKDGVLHFWELLDKYDDVNDYQSTDMDQTRVFKMAMDSPEDCDVVHRLFFAIDGDNDGEISFDEVAAASTRFQGTFDAEVARTTFAAVDKSGDGGIDYPEWEQKGAQLAFLLIDGDGDTAIEKNEWTNAGLSLNCFDDFDTSTDTAADDRITSAEFEAGFNPSPQKITFDEFVPFAEQMLTAWDARFDEDADGGDAGIHCPAHSVEFATIDGLVTPNGNIDAAEWNAYYPTMVFILADNNADDSVSFAEFETIKLAVGTPRIDRAMFDACDGNGDGILTNSEFTACFQTWSGFLAVMRDDMFNDADVNNDGSLNLEEFKYTSSEFQENKSEDREIDREEFAAITWDDGILPFNYKFENGMETAIKFDFEDMKGSDEFVDREEMLTWWSYMTYFAKGNFMRADGNMDGDINIAEWTGVREGTTALCTNANKVNIFNKYDVDHSKSLDYAEVMSAMTECASIITR